MSAYNHTCEQVNLALRALDSALCEHERLGGGSSAVIVRDDRGFVHRSLDGKPFVHDVSDEDVLVQVTPLPPED